MANKSKHSREDTVEDWCKRQLSATRYHTKIEEINPEISPVETTQEELPY